jgi:hypothetical protein
MQTIKCVVVGDGAVGKVSVLRLLFGPALKTRLVTDLSVDIVHHEQIPKRVCSNCMYEHILPRNNMQTYSS